VQIIIALVEDGVNKKTLRT